MLFLFDHLYHWLHFLSLLIYLIKLTLWFGLRRFFFLRTFSKIRWPGFLILESYGVIMSLLLLFRHYVPPLFVETWIAYVRFFFLFNHRRLLYLCLFFLLFNSWHFSKRWEILALGLLQGIIVIPFMTSYFGLAEFRPILWPEFLNSPVNLFIANDIKVFVAYGCLLLIFSLF